MSDDLVEFALAFTPNYTLIRYVREFLEVFFSSETLLLPIDASRLALTTHELLTNSVRYASTTNARILARVDKRPDAHLLTVESTNTASVENIARVTERIAAMREASDIDAYYTGLMHRVALQPLSGLGLGRIRAEAELALDVRVAGDLLTISATGRLTTGSLA